jgi:predicted DNA-binding transcriptional regulator AlpA
VGSHGSDNLSAPQAVSEQRRRRHALPEGCGSVGARMKERQSSKIGEIRDAVLSGGFLTVEEQAKALGLSRSTTWAILKGTHKASGLSASIINRMLAAPQLPPLVRSKILEYVEEKAAGLYGGNSAQRHGFTARLSIKRVVAAETSPKTRQGDR